MAIILNVFGIKYLSDFRGCFPWTLCQSKARKFSFKEEIISYIKEYSKSDSGCFSCAQSMQRAFDENAFIYVPE